MKLQIIARANQTNFISDIITIVMTDFETQKHMICQFQNALWREPLKFRYIHIYTKNYLTRIDPYMPYWKNIQKSGIHMESVQEIPDPEFQILEKNVDIFFLIHLWTFLVLLKVIPTLKGIHRPRVFLKIRQCLEVVQYDIVIVYL